MESETEKMAPFRQRAKECRAHAAEMKDAKARIGLIKSAESYERMAAEIAAKLADKPPP